MFFNHVKVRSTGKIISKNELILRHTNISFPAEPWPQSTYDYLGIDPVLDIPAPTVDEFSEAREVGYTQRPDGVWVQRWEVVSKYIPEEIAEIQNLQLQQEWDGVRAHRDELLAATDYTQLIDTPITDACRAEFAAYRQALRDITNIPDPNTVVWPIKPLYVKSEICH